MPKNYIVFSTIVLTVSTNNKVSFLVALYLLQAFEQILLGVITFWLFLAYNKFQHLIGFTI